MPFDVLCPECEKKLRLRDELAGKKIKCPKCGEAFVAENLVAQAAPDDDGYETEEVPVERKKRRSSREPDDDDDDRPRKKKGARKPESVTTPIAPLVWGIVAILCPIGMLIGFIAMYRAWAALAELPEGRRGDIARRNMWIAFTLGAVGAVESLIAGIIGTYLRFASG
ncbi:MAG: hypothetical protein HYX68_10430 [Planctomycetes bacterium]|jgi:uncharacterized Zn finger protein (UPF0148 family)|nr:hypothetical protein [Planctomycetota bacterium]